MHFSSIYLLSTLPFTLAQYGNDGSGGSTTSTAAGPATTTASSSGSVHTVTVGNGAFAFSPNSIVAAINDTVEFHFYPPEHSVAQSLFDAPCVPSGPTAFFSGPISTTSGQNANVFTLTINDTNPIWFYCAVPSHCESGMAGVINPP
jgi:plastocyanin